MGQKGQRFLLKFFQMQYISLNYPKKRNFLKKDVCHYFLVITFSRNNIQKGKIFFIILCRREKLDFPKIKKIYIK